MNPPPFSLVYSSLVFQLSIKKYIDERLLATTGKAQ